MCKGNGIFIASTIDIWKRVFSDSCNTLEEGLGECASTTSAVTAKTPLPSTESGKSSSTPNMKSSSTLTSMIKTPMKTLREKVADLALPGSATAARRKNDEATLDILRILGLEDQAPKVNSIAYPSTPSNSNRFSTPTPHTGGATTIGDSTFHDRQGGSIRGDCSIVISNPNPNPYIDLHANPDPKR